MGGALVRWGHGFGISERGPAMDLVASKKYIAMKMYEDVM